MKITFEELKEEAKRQGYGLHPLMRGICTCVISREKQLINGRKRCLKYEPIPLTGNRKIRDAGGRRIIYDRSVHA